MNDLRTAAQQALAFIRTMNQHGWMLADHEGDMERTVAGLEAALAQSAPPPEARTEAEKTAYAAGWWDALEAQRKAQPEPEPVAWTPAELAASLKRGEKWKLVEPAPEPVAWVLALPDGRLDRLSVVAFDDEAEEMLGRSIAGCALVPLYPTPPQRKPLTEEEIRTIGRTYSIEVWADDGWSIDFARAIEAAHGIIDSEIKEDKA